MAQLDAGPGGILQGITAGVEQSGQAVVQAGLQGLSPTPGPDPNQALIDAIAAAQQQATSGTNPNSWMDASFTHYLGHLPTPAEVNQVIANGWNEDDLVDHLRSQPSYIPGMTIGALEDYHKAAGPSFFKWLGIYPSDADIKDLVAHGVKSTDDIEKYLTNRPDVVAAHPGAPIGLTDVQYGQHKAAIDSDYQANLGRNATDQEARDAYSQSASPFRKQPAEQFGLASGVTTTPTGVNAGALISQAQIAPNVRNAQSAG